MIELAEGKPLSARTTVLNMMKSILAPLIIVLSLTSAWGARASDVEVKMLNDAGDGQRGFEPALVRIHPGDTVHFMAVDKGHSIQSIPGMLPSGASPFSGQISQDLIVKFDKPGVYGYRCVPHYMLGMVGLVVVGAPVNEAAARDAPQPRDAKAGFDKLFSALDADMAREPPSRKH